MLELALSQEKIWFDKYKYDEAEKVYFEKLAKLLIKNGVPTPISTSKVATAPETVNNPKLANKKTVSAAKPVPSSETVTIPKVASNAETVFAASAVPVVETVSAPEDVSPPTKASPTPIPIVQPVTIKIADSHTVQTEEKRFKVKDKHSKSKKRVSDKLNKEEKKVSSNTPTIMKNTLADEVAKARQHIKSSLECMDGIAMLASGNATVEINNRINSLENENTNLKQEVRDLALLIKKLETRIDSLEKVGRSADTGSKPAAASKPTPAPAPSPAKPKDDDDDDDDDDGVDLFGSDSEEEDEEAKRIKEQRVAEYAAKKSKKPHLIAKSNIILDVKPWDDETDMKKLEEAVRGVNTDGLVWGASKLVPLAYGIHKLQISCVVEDEKVSVDWLQETIQELEDYVQSVDIAAFNKV